MPGPSRRAAARDVALILLSTVAVVGLLMLLRSLGLPFGLRTPAGGGPQWLAFLSRPGAAARAQAFWAAGHRDPLSPWWYVAADRLYRGVPAGPTILRLAMSPLLGLSAYAMIRAATRGRAAGLGLAAGLVVAGIIWARPMEPVGWNALGALGLTMLCIACFAQWLNGARQRGSWYGLSLVLWFAAFCTDGFQTGAIAGVALLALLRPADPATPALHRAGQLAAELLPYAGLYVLAVLVWTTMGAAGLGAMSGLDLPGALSSLPRALLEGLWPVNRLPDAWAAIPHLGWALLPILAAAGLAAAGLTAWASRGTSATGRGDALLILGLALGIVLPTLLSGGRWQGVEQVWLPLLWLGGVALAASLLPLRDGARRGVLAAGTGMVAAAALLITLGHNAALTERGRAEQNRRERTAGHAASLVHATDTGGTAPDALAAFAEPAHLRG